MLQLVNLFLSFMVFLVFPCLCCLGITYTTRKNGLNKIKEGFVRITSFFGFIILWFHTYFIYTMNYKSEIRYDIPYMYDRLVIGVLPVFILIIAFLYTYLSKRSEKMILIKKHVLLLLCLLVADLQFLALVQIQPIFLTAVRQQDHTLIYKLTWVNILPFLSINLVIFIVIIYKAHRTT